jgi:hypothetical protein
MIYDEVLIGSGLCIYSYTLGLSKRGKKESKILCLSTDKILSNTQSGHPKLFEMNYKIIENYDSKLYGPTSSLGGLSVAWGGVLYKPIKNYRMGRDLELINNTSIEILKNLSQQFKIYKKVNSNWISFNDSNCYDLVDFYLLTSGSPYGWENSGINIFPAIEALFNNLEIPLLVKKVIQISYDQKLEFWEISTADSVIIKTKKIILGAGGLGNLEIISNSFKVDISIKDHVPHQFFAFSFPFLKLKSFCDKSTPIRNVIYFDDDVASIYSLRDISNEFRIKIIPKWIPFKFLISKILQNFIFIQYWSDQTCVNLAKNIKMNINFFYILCCGFNLVKHGFFPFYYKCTNPGEGFHYSAPFCLDNGNPYINFNKNLIILGGFFSTEIRPEHPTFSFMIDAYIKGANCER